MRDQRGADQESLDKWLLLAATWDERCFATSGSCSVDFELSKDLLSNKQTNLCNITQSWCLLKTTVFSDSLVVPPSEKSTNFMDDSVLTDMECKEVSLLYIKSNARKDKDKVVYCT